jgi:hypothetical protein
MCYKTRTSSRATDKVWLPLPLSSDGRRLLDFARVAVLAADCLLRTGAPFDGVPARKRGHSREAASLPPVPVSVRGHHRRLASKSA